MCVTTNCSTQVGEGQEDEEETGPASAATPPPCHPTPRSYLTLCDMCSGVSISSKMAPFTLEPRRFASCRSQPERSQFCRDGRDRQDFGFVGFLQTSSCGELVDNKRSFSFSFFFFFLNQATNQSIDFYF